MQNHINLRGEIKGLVRTDTYEIPQVALREALINALIHRDYINGGRDIKVGIYDDIVNIVSPGSFPNTITAEDIMSGRSEARNKVVANVFKELGLIEQWGSGINRIKMACKESGLKEPKIEEKNDFVDVEFYRPFPTDYEQKRTITDEKVLESTGKLSETTDYDRLRPITTDYDGLEIEEKKILLYLLDNDKATRKEAVELLGHGETKIKEIFNSLLEKELIRREGQGRSTNYKLVKVTYE